MYYAFRGNRPVGKGPIAGPFHTRAKAKEYGKPGHICRICGKYSGGNTICYDCIMLAFSGGKLCEIL